MLGSLLYQALVAVDDTWGNTAMTESGLVIFNLI